MKLKSLLAICILAVVYFWTSSSASVEFEDANPNFERQLPKENVVVSYNSSIEGALSAVVNISTEKNVKNQPMGAHPFFNDPFFKEFFGHNFDNKNIPQDRVERSLGSGVIVTKDGYIITNNHVIAEADKILVLLPNDTKEYEAKLIGSDPKSDLAVIKIESKELPFVKFADSSKSKIGDVVFAIGNPFGVGETVTSGIISALNKNGVGINAYENYIQTDASINPGNSGGALVDSRGALVGINTAIISKSGGNVGIGFAIPSAMVKKIAKELIEKGKVTHGYLGVTTKDISNDTKGFYLGKSGAIVIDIQKDSPAFKAKLKRGDLIFAIDEESIKDAAALRNKIGFMGPGKKITLSYLRDKKEFKTDVVLENLDKAMKIAHTDEIFGGIGIEEQNGKVVISSVKIGSNAQKVGFEKGDIIVQIEDIEITNLEDFNKALSKYSGKKRVYFERGNSTWMVVTE